MPAKKNSPWPKNLRDVNFYDADWNLHVFLRRYAHDILSNHHSRLSDLGFFAAGRLDQQAKISDQIYPPILRDLPNDKTAPSDRTSHIYLNPEYEDCQQELYRRGFLAECFTENPASQILPFIGQYIVSKSDIATGCPFAMTHPVALVLKNIAPSALRDKYLPEIIRTDGQTAICGTWATERHSGSDIGNTTTTAINANTQQNHYHLHGHNWFTSAFGFKKFLAIKTARPEGAEEGNAGLGLYLVPSHTDEKWKNANSFNITHLKQKLGTRGLPTVEIELKGTKAFEISPAGEGLRTMMVALGCSRVHNAMAAAGVMHRAFMEACSWTYHRETFGARLISRPMIRKRILDIGVEWLAGSALAFEAARYFDQAATYEQDVKWSRMATALAKYKTAIQAVWCAQKALELVGGNGYTEDYATARQFRDAMVLPVWEGPEQIQALELMRLITGSDGGGARFLKRLTDIITALPQNHMQKERNNIQSMHDQLQTALSDLHNDYKNVETYADEFLQNMADVLAYALLCDEAAWELQQDNNPIKLDAARYYYDRHFRPQTGAPVMKESTLMAHFEDFITL